MKKDSLAQPQEKFVPKGALAFFGLVLLVMAVIWLFVYVKMIKQA
jgi:hypothetical protein